MRRAILVGIGILVSCTDTSSAQVRASEAAMVQQTVDGTKITIEYSRPAVRGRNPFGGVVHWGERWTPGANWATTIEADKDIRLAGHALAKGKYTIWLVPHENADWTFVVDKRKQAYHTMRTDTNDAVLKFTVKPEQAPHVERLTFTFPTITPDGTVLEFRWGTTQIQLPIRVSPSRPLTVDASEIRRLSGTYALTGFRGNPQMEVFAEGNKLRARLTPAQFDFDGTFDLVPVARDRYNPLFYKGGQPFDTEDFAIVFVNSDAGVRAEWRGINERVIATGVKN
ncbi:MAG TPA: DUF2911 domain-containing protein [Longimicrobiales bacterium]